MSIQLPELATRTYRDILDEMVSSIPKYSENWTNYNPSDPGIMILEILAWIFDATLYRIDRLPEETYLNFLRLVAGAEGEEVAMLLDKLNNNPNSDRYHIDLLEFLQKIEDKNEEGKTSTTDMKAAVLKFMQSNYRAITKENFEALAIEATNNRGNDKPKVKKAIVNGNLDGNVEIIIISDRLDHYGELKETVKKYIEPRKLICTKIIVKEPVYSHLNIYIEVVLLPNILTDLTSKKIRDNIIGFLDPLKGGDEKKGWIYGRAVSIFELFHIIEETEGVDHAESVIMDENPSLKIKQIEGLINPIDIIVNFVENTRPEI